MAKRVKLHFTFLSPILGTSSADPEIHKKFIASKAPDAETREEEIARIGATEYEEKSMTVFPRSLKTGQPVILPHQFKGFCKEACASLQKCKSDGKPEPFAKHSCGIKAFKKYIDQVVFLEQSEVPINVPSEMDVYQRPLRGQTAQGERIALASSERIPKGATADFSVIILNNDLVPALIEWLNYGKLRGMMQFRNGGFGRFTYTYEVEDFKELPDIVETE